MFDNNHNNINQQLLRSQQLSERFTEYNLQFLFCSPKCDMVAFHLEQKQNIIT